MSVAMTEDCSHSNQKLSACVRAWTTWMSLVGLLIAVFVCVAVVLNRHPEVPTFWINEHINKYEHKSNGEGNAPLAARALSPQVSPVSLAHDTDLAQILDAARVSHSETLSGYLHVLHIFGPDVKVPVGSSGQDIRPLDVVRGVQSVRGSIDTSFFVFPTRHGVRYALFDPLALSRPQKSSEAHPGQGLAVFGSLGLPLESSLFTSAGEQFEIRDLLNEVVANFVLEGEIYWDAVGLTLYLAPQRSWTNKFGVQFSFDDLCEELMGRSPEASSCAGTHALIALAVLHRVDECVSVLDRETSTRLRQFLSASVERLIDSELPGGGWTTGWWRPGAGEIDPAAADTGQVILATGHHLEWIMLLPADMQPPRELMNRAVQKCVTLLSEKVSDSDWVSRNYCPFSHAVRSVCLLTGTDLLHRATTDLRDISSEMSQRNGLSLHQSN